MLLGAAARRTPSLFNKSQLAPIAVGVGWVVFALIPARVEDVPCAAGAVRHAAFVRQVEGNCRESILRGHPPMGWMQFSASHVSRERRQCLLRYPAACGNARFSPHTRPRSAPTDAWSVRANAGLPAREFLRGSK